MQVKSLWPACSRRNEASRLAYITVLPSGISVRSEAPSCIERRPGLLNSLVRSQSWQQTWWISSLACGVSFLPLVSLLSSSWWKRGILAANLYSPGFSTFGYLPHAKSCFLFVSLDSRLKTLSLISNAHRTMRQFNYILHVRLGCNLVVGGRPNNWTQRPMTKNKSKKKGKCWEAILFSIFLLWFECNFIWRLGGAWEHQLTAADDEK